MVLRVGKGEATTEERLVGKDAMDNWRDREAGPEPPPHCHTPLMSRAQRATTAG
jgi:hypothetical protein